MSRQILLVTAMFGCAFLTLAAAGHAAQAADDRLQIEQTARDYIEGWYTADPVRMARALHPDLIKRYVETLPDGQQVVKSINREQMVELTRTGGGSKTPADRRKISIQVLDISGEIAAVKTISPEYVDLLSLAKIQDHWVILNVLWRFVPASGPAATKK